MARPSSVSAWQIGRSEATARGAMVVADRERATLAGLDILAEGGNAVDAAVCAAFVMGVVEPVTSGIGGVASMVIRTKDGHLTVVDGSTTAPQGARPDMFEVLDTGERLGMYGWPATRDNANNVGYRSLGVPGMVACLLDALDRYGTLPRDRVMAPAIALARDGFDVDWYLGLAIGTYADRLWVYPETKRTFYRASGAPLRVATGFEPADRLVQADLARSLEAIARRGAKAFYDGPLAQAICDDVQANGGLLTAAEFASYRSRELAPLRSSYRGHELATVPGPSGAVTALELLNIVEASDLGRPDSAAERHLVLEASRRAFVDRFAHLADVPGAPFERLASKEHARERAASIEPSRATPEIAAGAVPPPQGDCTTHLCVVDRDGAMVSLTSTLGQGFGSGVVIRGTGIVMADVMTWFDPRSGTINSPAPGKRILWAPSPMLLLDGGRPFLAVGAPGGRRIMSAVPQVVMNIVDHGMGPQAAVARPRVHAEGRPSILDARIEDSVQAELRAMGHELELREETFFSSHFARPSAILVDASGMKRAGANPLKPALAAGLD
ncbi:MAG TPA: gamma-glutamyltransferase [Candidatus Limnocylindria bacterium]|nr:gamma-glutamyltransferase [Candidatus Limnocylindria bacterium]